jgi:hypothetical protein
MTTKLPASKAKNLTGNRVCSSEWLGILPAGWYALEIGDYIQTGDKLLNCNEDGWQNTEFKTEMKMRVGGVERVNGKYAPYIRRLPNAKVSNDHDCE